MKRQQFLGWGVLLVLAVILVVVWALRDGSDVSYRFKDADTYITAHQSDPDGLGKGGIVGGLLVPEIIPACATDIRYRFDMDVNKGLLTFACDGLDVEAYSAAIAQINEQGLPWMPQMYDGSRVEMSIIVPMLAETEN